MVGVRIQAIQGESVLAFSFNSARLSETVLLRMGYEKRSVDTQRSGGTLCEC